MVMAPSAILLHPEDTIIEKHGNPNYGETTHHGGQQYESADHVTSAKDLVKHTLQQQIAKIDTDTCEPDAENAFYVGYGVDVVLNSLSGRSLQTAHAMEEEPRPSQAFLRRQMQSRPTSHPTSCRIGIWIRLCFQS